jgi:TetR/AcrR family transcriptional regulator, fatty acid metabolism regulator protein
MPKISEQKKELKRQTILDAAVRLFAQKGFHGVSTAELAESAGVAEGTIFRYFSSKDKLLISALDRAMERLLEALRRDDDPQSPVTERLLRFIGNHLHLIREHPELARFIIVELRQTPEFLRRYPRYRPLDAYLDFLREILREGMEQGSLRRVDLESLVSMIFGTMDYVLTRWHLNGTEVDLGKVIADLRDIMYNGLKPEAL